MNKPPRWSSDPTGRPPGRPPADASETARRFVATVDGWIRLTQAAVSDPANNPRHVELMQYAGELMVVRDLLGVLADSGIKRRVKPLA